MGKRLRWNWFEYRMLVILMLSCSVLGYNLSFCSALNSEGMALLKFKEKVSKDPFNALLSWEFSHGGPDLGSWFGVECSDGKVVKLDLTDLRLEGKLAPELSQLTHLKSLVLRNNLFSGMIPEEIGELKELQVLDLRSNNFSGPLPSNFANNLSFLVYDNEYLSRRDPENNVEIVSASQVIDDQLVTDASRETHSRNTMRPEFLIQRKLLQVTTSGNPMKAEKQSLRKKSSTSKASSPSATMSPSPLPFSSISISPSAFILAPIDSPSPSPSVSKEAPPLPRASSPSPITPMITVRHRRISPAPLFSPTSAPQTVKTTTKPNHRVIIISSGVIGCALLLFVLAFAFFYFRSSKVVTVKPWATGLSGQLQKAFVAGVPKLHRSELEAACEGFSNIIGSLPNGTIYKGILSSGVEIAVTSTKVKSADDWSKNLETQFINKIDTLSRLNHRNFVNLIGYCEEAKPFTRMMVFEYAPNGTLFEHLHVKESEHLDWVMRLRIAMGVAYCLEYMHHLIPPMAHKNLQSSSIYLTEDYAAKISDFSFWNEVSAAKTGPANTELLETQSEDLENNVYSFGLILLEIITGKLPYSGGHGFVSSWIFDYLRQEMPLREVVDPTLKSFEEQQLVQLLQVAKECVLSDPTQRPTMRDVTSKLKEVTGLGQDGVTPKSSPLWWAELEILSAESS